MSKIFNRLLSITDRNTNSKEVIQILDFLQFLFINNLITFVEGLEYLENVLSISEERAQDDTFCICESFRSALLLSATVLVVDHVRYYYFSEFFYCLLLFILNMSVIFIWIYYCLSDINLIILRNDRSSR